jgi:hypothetical protein
MPNTWKILIVSLVIYQAVLTGCFLKMADYTMWWLRDCVRFDKTCSAWAMADTGPGAATLMWIGGSAFVLVSLNLFMFWRVPPSRPIASPPKGSDG